MKKLAILIILCNLSLSAYAKYSGGTGETGNPYLIATSEDLDAVGDNTNDWDKHFLLTADINMAGYIYTTAVIAYEITNNRTYVFEGIPFTGVFDGNNHTISALVINGNEYLGLFGQINPGGNVKNLKIEDSTIFGDNTLGLLCGKNNAGFISRCYATGSVTGHWAIGGLIGINRYGSILDSHSTVQVLGIDETGGLVGANITGMISNCYSTGLVNGGQYGYEIGGLVGGNWEDSTISQCYSIGAVIGDELVGGVVGYNKDTILNCYATGPVTGNTGSTGGLAGGNWGTVYNCYATGAVNVDTHIGGGLIGFCWWEHDIVTGSFWDIETSEISTSNGGTGKTTIEMQTKSTFTGAGWDFNSPVWKICDGLHPPKLWWEDSVPIAVAGPNQVVYVCADDELADVTLDGSGSCDADGDELDYYWSWIVDSNVFEANGVSPTVQLPVGEYEIELVVDDGVDESEPNYCTVTVVEPLHAKLSCRPWMLNTQSRRGIITAIVYMPAGITPDDIDANEPLVFICDSGQVESTRQFVFERHKRGRPCTWVMASFNKDDCMDYLSEGVNRIKVAGRLNSGRCYYGNSSIYVFKPRPFRRLWKFQK